MEEKKPKLLMTGPGHGINILKSLDYLNNDNAFETWFLTRFFAFNKADFPNIKVIEYHHPNKYFRLIKLFLRLFALPKFSLLFMQDNMGYDFFMIKWFLRYKKLVFNIWSEYVIYNFNKNGLSGIISRVHLNSADSIICLWYGTYNKLIASDNKFEKIARVFPMGLMDSFFKDEPVKSEFMKDFLKKITNDKFVLLNVRSISEYNEIEILLDAILLIKGNNPLLFNQLLLIFWHGNNVDNFKLNYINDFIQNNHLEDMVWCVLHPFVPDSDIKNLIKRSNVVVNLVKHDQLSTSIYESMYLEKDLLCSDIEAYRILNEKYHTNLDLIENNPIIVADEIARFHSTDKSDKDYLALKELRKKVVVQNLSLTNNQKRKFDYIKQL
jgi:hypothetical protein